MSSINGTCSESHSLLQIRNPLEQGLRQQQAQGLQAGANPQTPAAPGNGAIQLAASLNAPAHAPASVPEPNKGANIDIHV